MRRVRDPRIADLFAKNHGTEPSIRFAYVPPQLSQLQGQLLNFIERRQTYGATTSEATTALALLILTVRPAFRALELAGHIRKTGRHRKNARGRREHVFVGRQARHGERQ